MSGAHFIISRAHNWAQALPLRDNMLVCVDCGHREPMKPQPGFRKRCHRKGESITSGYSGPVVEQISGTIVGRAGRWPQPWKDGTAMIYGIRIFGSK